MGVSTGIYSRSSEVLEKVQDLNVATKVTKIGYFRPLRVVAAEIRPLASFVPDIGAYLPVTGRPRIQRTCQLPRETVWKILSTTQSPYHHSRHRDIDERFSGGAQPLIVLAHPPVLREPREGAFHHPTPRQDLEAPARKQLLPIDLPALFGPLLRPHHRDLLRRRLGSAMHDLDAQV